MRAFKRFFFLLFFFSLISLSLNFVHAARGDQPTNFKATQSGNDIIATWNQSPNWGDNIKHYTIWAMTQDGKRTKKMNITKKNYTFTNLAKGNKQVAVFLSVTNSKGRKSSMLARFIKLKKNDNTDNKCTESSWSFSISPESCPSSGIQTKYWKKTSSCEGGVTKPSKETLTCEYSNKCTQADWSSSISPEKCPSSGKQTKYWKKTSSCEGGVSKPNEETISCEYSNKCTKSDWSSSISPEKCPSSGQQMRYWKKTSNCEGGVTKPNSEKIKCTYNGSNLQEVSSLILESEYNELKKWSTIDVKWEDPNKKADVSKYYIYWGKGENPLYYNVNIAHKNVKKITIYPTKEKTIYTVKFKVRGINGKKTTGVTKTIITQGKNEEEPQKPQCTLSDWASTLSPKECPSSGKQTKYWSKKTDCEKGVSKPTSETISCTPITPEPPEIPKCSESDWSYVLDPKICPSSGIQSKNWMKINECEGGVTKPKKEQIVCEPVLPKCKESDWSYVLDPKVCPSSGEQTKYWQVSNLCKGGVTKPKYEKIQCSPQVPKCTENDWQSTLEPIKCPSSGKQNRYWTKKNECDGGIKKPSKEEIACEPETPEVPELPKCTNDDWTFTLEPSICPIDSKKQTRHWTRINECENGVTKPESEEIACIPELPKCKEESWSYILDPKTCPASGKQTKYWALQENCEGGVTKPKTEAITCEPDVPDDPEVPLCTPADWSYLLEPNYCPESGYQTKKWTKINECQEGQQHPDEENITCDYHELLDVTSLKGITTYNSTTQTSNIDLEWKDSNEKINISKYQVFWSEGNEILNDNVKDINKNNLSVIIRDLKPQTEYTFKIIIIGINNNKTEGKYIKIETAKSDDTVPDDPENDTTAPENVTNVFAKAYDGLVEVFWDPSLDSQGDLETYKLYLSQDLGQSYYDSVKLKNVSSYVFFNLENNRNYFFKITSIDTS